MKLSPIIFCHYGVSDYLIYTLRQARFTNPNCRIILLGDIENRVLALEAKVEHFIFEQYAGSSELIEFEKVYRHIAGERHGKALWTKFVFKRWFYVHSFIKNENIEAFWHFDSDNMILTDLSLQESKFKSYDCTEQCGGICINGFISSFKTIDGYVKKINELFKNEEYLHRQLQDFKLQPTYAFTEMRAYKTYRLEEAIKSIRLNSIIDDETFDDCICHDDGYDVYDYAINNRILKKIYIDDQKVFYFYHIGTSTFVRVNSLNLSWVPLKLFIFVENIVRQPISYNKRILKKDGEFYLLHLKILRKKRWTFKKIYRTLILKRLKIFIRIFKSN